MMNALSFNHRTSIFLYPIEPKRIAKIVAQKGQNVPK